MLIGEVGVVWSMRALFVVLMIALAGCSSSEPVATADAEPEVTPEATKDTGAIVGVVVDETIVPLVDVVVRTGGLETATDETGAFVFNGLEPGMHQLVTEPEGHFPTAVEVLVVAGQIAEARLIAMTDNRVEGYHDTVTFNGRMEAYLGPGSLVLEAIQPGATGCTCSFPLELANDPRTHIIEAFGDASMGSNPAGDDLFWELFQDDDPNTADDENFTVNGGGKYPLYGTAPESLFPGNIRERTVRLSGGAWIHAQEAFELFVTTFYVDQAPAGWSIQD